MRTRVSHVSPRCQIAAIFYSNGGPWCHGRSRGFSYNVTMQGDEQMYFAVEVAMLLATVAFAALAVVGKFGSFIQ